MAHHKGDPAVLASAFPRALHSDVEEVFAVLPQSSSMSMILTEGHVHIEGELVERLARFDAPALATDFGKELTPRQAAILASLYARHFDGYVRERFLPKVRGDFPWLPPVILQVVSEYVRPIAQVALDNIDAIPLARYQAFASENPQFMAAVQDRILSYHHVYYFGWGGEGRRAEHLLDNPAYRFLNELGLWSGNPGKRWVRLSKASRARSAATGG